MDIHDLITLLSSLAVLIGAITGFLVVYYRHQDKEEEK